MSRLQSFVAAAMESIQETEVTVVNPVEHDEAVGNVEEAYREVESCMTDTETLEEVREGLEALVATLEALEEPLCSRAALYMNIAAESHLVRVGLDMDDAPIIPSFESDAAMSTKLSVDSIKAKLKAIWEAIKRTFEAVRKAIVAFFTHLFDANERLAKRAVALGEAAKNADTDKPVVSHFNDEALVHKIHVGGQTEHLVVSFHEAVLFFDFMQDGVNKENAEQMAKVNGVGKAFVNAQTDADVQKAISDLKHVSLTRSRALPNEHSADGHRYYSSKELPGGMKFVIKVEEKQESDDPLQHLDRLIKSMVVAPLPSSLSHLDPKLPVLALHDIGMISKAAANAARFNQGYKRMLAEIEKQSEELGRQIANFRSDTLSEESQRTVIGVFRHMGRLGATQMRAMSVIARYGATISRDFVIYGEKSLSFYRKPGKGPGPHIEVAGEPVTQMSKAQDAA